MIVTGLPVTSSPMKLGNCEKNIENGGPYAVEKTLPMGWGTDVLGTDTSVDVCISIFARVRKVNRPRKSIWVENSKEACSKRKLKDQLMHDPDQNATCSDR